MGMRVVSRGYPDANQLGITGNVTINESRVTFTGARGTVMVIWPISFNNPGAVVVGNITVLAIGSAAANALTSNGRGHLPAVIGSDIVLYAFALIIDPPAGSFLELQVQLGANVVDVSTGNQRYYAFSLPTEPGDGPEVTVQ